MKSPRLRLLAAVSAVTVVWLVALPWFSRRPGTSTYIEQLDRQKIDPSAMYYTELEMMKPIFTRLALQQRIAKREAGTRD